MREENQMKSGVYALTITNYKPQGSPELQGATLSSPTQKEIPWVAGVMMTV